MNSIDQAIWENDKQKVFDLSRDPKLLAEPNQWGYTPQEMALYLGRQALAGMMDPHPAKQLRVQLRGGSEVGLYSAAEFPHLFQVEYTPSLLFTHPDAFRAVLRQCPYLLRIGTAIELGERYREQIRRGFVVDTVIRWIDETIGYGLFANQSLFEGEFVGEYTGQVHRMRRRRGEGNAYCVHYPTRFWSWDYWVIDGLHAGNEMRFANHSDSPNLRHEWVSDRGLLHLLFFAQRPIAKGEQLTYHYGPDFWVLREKMQL